MKKRRVIWTNDINYLEWFEEREQLLENKPQCLNCPKKDTCMECDVFLTAVNNFTAEYFQALQSLFDVTMKNYIIAFTEIGSIDGFYYKVLGYNFAEVFSLSGDVSTYYFDGYNLMGEFYIKGQKFRVAYRMLKPDLPLSAFYESIKKKTSKFTAEDRARYTVSLLKPVKSILTNGEL